MKYRIKGTTIPAGSLVSVTANGGAGWGGEQRTTWYAAGRYWVIYSNGTDFFHISSKDGATNWTSATTILSTTNARAYKMGIYWDGSYIHFSTGNSGNTGILYKRGTCAADGTISWETTRTISSSGEANQTYANVTKDTNGYPWVVFFSSTGTIYKPWICKASATDGSTWNSAAALHTTQGTNGSGAAVHPLSSGKMAVLWVDTNASAQKLYLKKFNGSSWDTDPTVIATGMTSNGAHSSIVDTVNDDIHIIYYDSSSNIKYVKWNYTNGLGTAFTLKSSAVSSLGVLLTKGAGNKLYAFYPGSDRYIYCRAYTGSTWRVEDEFYDAGSDVDLSSLVMWLEVPNQWTDTVGGLFRQSSTNYLYYVDWYDLTSYIYANALDLRYNLNSIVFVTASLIMKYNLGGLVSQISKMIYNLLATGVIISTIKIKYSIRRYIFNTNPQILFTFDLSNTSFTSLNSEGSYDTEIYMYHNVTPENHYNAGGKIGGCLYFTTLDTAWIYPAVAVEAWTNNFTIEAWFKFPSVPFAGKGICKSDMEYSTGSFCLIDSAISTNKISFKYKTSTTTWGAKNLIGTTTLVADTWYHVAVTYDGSYIRLYLNGNEEDNEIETGNLYQDIDYSLMLAGCYFGTNVLNSYIDMPIFYNTALTSTELKKHANADYYGKYIKIIYKIYNKLSAIALRLKYLIRRQVLGDAHFYDYFPTTGYTVISSYFDCIIQDGTYPNDFYFIVGGDGVDPYAIKWDGRKWSSYVKVGTEPLGNDIHGVPASIMDDNGRIHVFYGCHNTAIKYSQSTNVRDISSWTNCNTKIDAVTSATYPMPFKNPANGDLYILYRAGPAGSEFQWRMLKSTDDGVTWNESSPVVAIDETEDHIYPSTDGLLYIGGHYCWGFVWHYYDHGTGLRSDMHFAYLDMSNDHWYNAGGTDLGVTITRSEADTYCMVKSTYPYSSGCQHIIYTPGHNFLACCMYKTAGGGWYNKSWEWNGSSWTNEATVYDNTNFGGFILFTDGTDTFAMLRKDGSDDGTVYSYKYNWTSHSWAYNSVVVPGWVRDGYDSGNRFSGIQYMCTLNPQDSNTISTFILNQGEAQAAIQAYYFVALVNGIPLLIREIPSFLTKYTLIEGITVTNTLKLIYNILSFIIVSKTIKFLYRIRLRVSKIVKLRYVLYAAGNIKTYASLIWRLGAIEQILKFRQETPRYYYYPYPYIVANRSIGGGPAMDYQDHFHPSSIYAPIKAMNTESGADKTGYLYAGVQYPLYHSSDVACWKSPRLYGNQTISAQSNWFEIVLQSEQGNSQLDIVPWIYVYVDRDIGTTSHTLVKSLYSASTNKTASVSPSDWITQPQPITCSVTLSENLTVSDKDRLCIEVWHVHENQTITGNVKERFHYGGGNSSSFNIYGSGINFYKPVNASHLGVKYNIRDTTYPSIVKLRWHVIEPLYSALTMNYYILGLDWFLDTALPARGVNSLKMIPRAEIDIPEYQSDYAEKWILKTPSIHEFIFVDDFESYESVEDATSSDGWTITESGSTFKAYKTFSENQDMTEYNLLTFFARSDNPTGLVVNFVDNSDNTSSDLPFVINEYWQRYEASVSWGSASADQITKIQIIASYSGIVTLDDIFILNYADETENIHWTELNITDISYSRKNKFSTYKIPFRDTEIIQYSGEENAEGEFMMYNINMTQYSFVSNKQKENSPLYLRYANFGMPIIMQEFGREFKNVIIDNFSSVNTIPFMEIYNYKETVE